MANDSNFLRRVDLGFDRAVGTLHMLHGELTVGRCNASFDVTEMTEVWGDLNFRASLALDLNAEDVFRQKSDGTR